MQGAVRAMVEHMVLLAEQMSTPSPRAATALVIVGMNVTARRATRAIQPASERTRRNDMTGILDRASDDALRLLRDARTRRRETRAARPDAPSHRWARAAT